MAISVSVQNDGGSGEEHSCSGRKLSVLPISFIEITGTNIICTKNGGLFLDIKLLALYDYMGNPFNTMKSFCPYSHCSQINLLTCLEGFDAFILFFKHNTEDNYV